MGFQIYIHGVNVSSPRHITQYRLSWRREQFPRTFFMKLKSHCSLTTIVISRLILSLRRVAESRRLLVYSQSSTQASDQNRRASFNDSYVSTMVFRPQSFTSLEHSATRASVSPDHACRSAVENWLARVSIEEEREDDGKEADV